MSYTRVNWNSTTTYVSAENLNIMDKGIKDLDNNIGDVATLTTTAKTVVPAIKELKAGLDTVNNNLVTGLLGKIGKTTEAISNTNANDFKVGIRFGYGDNITNHPYGSGFLINISHPGADAGIQIAFTSNFGSTPSKPCTRSYLGTTFSSWTYFDGTIKA